MVMKRFFILVLINISYIDNVSCFKPNVFWNRAKTMTKFISGQVYKQGKKILNYPIIAKTKITNGGFYNGNEKYTNPYDNQFGANILYHGHVSSGYIHNTPTFSPIVKDTKYPIDGSYEEYIKSVSPNDSVLSYNQQFPATVPSTLPSTLPTPIPVTAQPVSSYINHLDMSRYTSTSTIEKKTYSTDGLYEEYRKSMSSEQSFVPTQDSVPVSTIEKKTYSTDGLYEEYRKSLQNTENVESTTATYGFYEGPQKSINDNHD